MKPGMILSGVLSLAVFAGLNLYLGWNGAVFWQEALPAVPVLWFWLLYSVLALSYIAAMLLRKALPYTLAKWLKIIGSYGLGILFYLIILVPLADLAYGILRLAGVARSAALLGTGWTTAAVLAAVMLVGSRNAWRTVIRHYELEVPKACGDGRKELRIAAASDIHLGAVVGNPHLVRLAKTMDKLKPDVILLAGDVLDDSLEPFIRENMAQSMKLLNAPLGVYASLGNHEYYGGHIGEYIRRMKEIGIRVLTDQVVDVEGSFYIAGRKDRAAEQIEAGGRQSVGQLLSATDPDRPVILMDHQPYALETAALAGVDLMLSGHTHRGQMAPAHLVTKRLFELDWGYLKKGAMHVIVSSGFGLWGPPIRLASRSEILDIRLKFV
ncbi:MAG: metallophosphoesterase [Paenibacillaceae bacterium]|jgi:predicted MPP superfamily phosphohydrolase|nr:metallophosphoesterase [Paenibacillaceae bacterium]